MSCDPECARCNPHGGPLRRGRYEYQDFLVTDAPEGGWGLATFRRPIPAPPDWERCPPGEEYVG